jgi:hypothetical protein
VWGEVFEVIENISQEVSIGGKRTTNSAVKKWKSEREREEEWEADGFTEHRLSLSLSLSFFLSTFSANEKEWGVFNKFTSTDPEEEEEDWMILSTKGNWFSLSLSHTHFQVVR